MRFFLSLLFVHSLYNQVSYACFFLLDLVVECWKVGYRTHALVLVVNLLVLLRLGVVVYAVEQIQMRL
jgi:hypothetical protein